MKTAMRKLPRTIGDYKVDSTPTLFVNGRYLTSPTHAAGRSGDQSAGAVAKATMQVLDVLVAKARVENMK